MNMGTWRPFDWDYRPTTYDIELVRYRCKLTSLIDSIIRLVHKLIEIDMIISAKAPVEMSQLLILLSLFHSNATYPK